MSISSSNAEAARADDLCGYRQAAREQRADHYRLLTIKEVAEWVGVSKAWVSATSEAVRPSQQARMSAEDLCAGRRSFPGSKETNKPPMFFGIPPLPSVHIGRRVSLARKRSMIGCGIYTPVGSSVRARTRNATPYMVYSR